MNCCACIELSGREPAEAPDGHFLGHAPLRRRVALTACLLFGLAGQAAAKPGDREASLAPAGKRAKAVGALVIVGGGSLPASIRQRFIELAGGDSARLVIIPTASGKVQPGHLQELGSYAYWTSFVKSGQVKSVTFLHTRSPHEANEAAFIKPLMEASGVWITGGDQSLLTAAYKGTAVERELRKLIDRGGVVGGTSAGAAVMSEIMIRNGTTVAEVGTGFGFLPPSVVIDQHFFERSRQARLLSVLAKHPECLGLGIDESTGIVVQGQSVTVVGKRTVCVCLPAQDWRSRK